ncbi:MAG TPA: hypothetical protein VJ111_12450 [Chitinophagaceae bacterium]|nr:hypothetical protein [Chitinophagaceae bacterium]
MSESATELLTQKSWTLLSYGYDHNANGLIDASEESIRDCEKDNRYSFAIDGNGLFEDNSLSCGNGIAEMPFTWRLIKDETLDFLYAVAKISRLDEVQLIIYHETMDANEPDKPKPYYMKNLNNTPIIFLFISYYFIKLSDTVLRPLKDIPKPDFNNEYDSAML